MKKRIDKEKIEKIIFEQILKASIEKVKSEKIRKTKYKDSFINENTTPGEINLEGTVWKLSAESDHMEWYLDGLEETYLRDGSKIIGKIEYIGIRESYDNLMDNYESEYSGYRQFYDMIKIEPDQYRCNNQSGIVVYVLEGQSQVKYLNWNRHILIQSGDSSISIPSFCKIQEIENKNIKSRIAKAAPLPEAPGPGYINVVDYPLSGLTWGFSDLTSTRGQTVKVNKGYTERSSFNLQRPNYEENVVWLSIGPATLTVWNVDIDSDDIVSYSYMDPLTGETGLEKSYPWNSNIKIGIQSMAEFKNNESSWEGVNLKARLPSFSNLRFRSLQGPGADQYEYDSEGKRDPFSPGSLDESKFINESALGEQHSWIEESEYALPDGLTSIEDRHSFCMGRAPTGKLNGKSRTWPNPRNYEELWNGFQCSTAVNIDGEPATWEYLQSITRIPDPGTGVNPDDETSVDSSATRQSGRRAATGPTADKIRELQQHLGIEASGRWTDKIDKEWAHQIKNNLYDLFIPPNLLRPIINDWNGAGRVIAGDLFKDGSSYSGNVEGMIQFLTLTKDFEKAKQLYYARPPESVAGKIDGSEIERRSSGPIRVNSIIVSRPLVMTVKEISGISSEKARRIANIVAGYSKGESERPLKIERLNMRRLKVTVPEGVQIKNMRSFKSAIREITEEGMTISLRIRRIPESS